jgi:parallel beta-helix repeat protein
VKLLVTSVLGVAALVGGTAAIIAQEPTPREATDATHTAERAASDAEAAAQLSPSPTPSTCPGTQLTPQMSEAQVEAALDAGAPTDTFCLAAGTYRMSLTPKAGQTLLGEPGAVLKGTRVATGWTQQGEVWTLDGATFNPVVESPPFGDSERSCEAIPPNCHYADLFKDGTRLTRVLADVTPPPESWHWDYAADRVYVNTSDPNAAFMELTDADTGIDTAGNNTIEGLSVQHYGMHGILATNGDVLRDNEYAWNHGFGFRMNSSGAVQIIGGHTHHNGQFGGSCSGSGKLIDGLEFSFNNNLHFATAQGGYWGAGAIKCVLTESLVVRNVYSHDNFSDGFWTDISNVGVLYENNRFLRNERFGIFHEISCSMEARGNVIQGNADDGIFIHSSTDADIHHNTFGNNGGAAVEIEDNLSRKAGCAANAGSYGNVVHDNTLNRDTVVGCSARNPCRDSG